MRAKLATSKLPASYWWYHLKSSTDVSSLLPLRDAPSESQWCRFTGAVPSCAGVRPIGCRVYPKLQLQPHKLSPQSVPCIYLGRARNQPGHMCLDPTTKRIYVSPHARFIESSFPGLTNPTPPAPIATPP
eukprot:3860854-Pleurochrysis_carterae.AAC.1